VRRAFLIEAEKVLASLEAEQFNVKAAAAPEATPQRASDDPMDPRNDAYYEALGAVVEAHPIGRGPKA
jgi:hypothetical protein